MNFEVRYLSEDGEVRYRTVEGVDSKKEAIERAHEDDRGNFGGDCILKIIDVTQV
jgi:hypothetical protein